MCIRDSVDPAEIGKNAGPSIPLVGDAKHIFQDFQKEEFEEYFKIVQEKFNEIPSDQEIASQECKQSQIKNQVIETLEKVILDIKTLK